MTGCRPRWLRTRSCRPSSGRSPRRCASPTWPSTFTRDGEAETAAAHGTLGRATPERRPLLYRDAVVAELVIGVPAGRELTAADQRLLDDLAVQAGVAVHAVRLTADLQHSRERLVTAREEERRRVRRDLHDGLGPTLAAAVLGLDASRRAVADDPGSAEQLLVDLRTQMQDAITDVRRLVYELRPPALDQLGLVGALREHAARISEPNGGLKVAVEAPDALPGLLGRGRGRGLPHRDGGDQQRAAPCPGEAVHGAVRARRRARAGDRRRRRGRRARDGVGRRHAVDAGTRTRARGHADDRRPRRRRHPSPGPAAGGGAS